MVERANSHSDIVTCKSTSMIIIYCVRNVMLSLRIVAVLILLTFSVLFAMNPTVIKDSGTIKKDNSRWLITLQSIVHQQTMLTDVTSILWTNKLFSRHDLNFRLYKVAVRLSYSRVAELCVAFANRNETRHVGTCGSFLNSSQMGVVAPHHKPPIPGPSCMALCSLN